MDEENKILNSENPVDIDNLDDLLGKNVSEDYTENRMDENIQNVEGIPPKKKSKLKKILFIILWVLGVLFLIRLAFVFLFMRWVSNIVEKIGSTSINVDQKDWLYKFNGRWSHNGVVNYLLTPVDVDKIVVWDDMFKVSYDDSLQNMITLSIEDYDWIERIYNYNSYIYLNLEFSGWKIINWSIVDQRSRENLGQPSMEELDKLYNFEAKYPMKEIKVNHMINLSSLDENVIYKYVVKATSDVNPWIDNDLDYAVIIYEKTSSDYEPKILLSKENESWWLKLESSEETHYLIYQRATREDLLYLLEPLSLGQYEHWEEIDIWNEDYLYNDTDEALRLVLIDESFWKKEEKDRKVLKPWEVYKKSSFIDYVIIK